MKIPITKPLFGAEELKAVQAPLESGWVVQGPYFVAGLSVIDALMNCGFQRTSELIRGA